ncbi:MAG: hypothetical protein U0905_01780 [Pirellulales bacterium]
MMQSLENPMDAPSQRVVTHSISHLRWLVAILVGVVGAWLLFQYPPIRYDIPERLKSVTMFSSQELIAEYFDAQNEVYRKNSFADLTLVGTCFGATALLISRGLKPWHNLIALAIGAFCGSIAAYFALYMSPYLIHRFRLPFADDSSQAMVSETLLFIGCSTIMVLPFASSLWLHGCPVQKRAAMIIPMSGVLTGIVAPITISAFFPMEPTHHFPPDGSIVCTIWIAILGVAIFFVSSHRKRQPKPTTAS